MDLTKISILILALLMVSTASASIEFLGRFKVNEDINLVQVCSTCTYNNITSVTAPNSSIILSNTAMTKQGNNYNYTLTGQSKVGTYNVCGIGDLDGTDTIWCYTFEVTQTGYQASTAQGIIYFILLLIGFALFIGILVFGLNIDPSKYDRDSITGKITNINWNRYIRMACWFVAYMLFVWMSSIAKSIAENFLNSTFLSTFFNTIFVILLSFALPLTIFFFFMFLVSFILDRKVKSLLERGLQP